MARSMRRRRKGIGRRVGWGVASRWNDECGGCIVSWCRKRVSRRMVRGRVARRGNRKRGRRGVGGIRGRVAGRRKVGRRSGASRERAGTRRRG